MNDHACALLNKDPQHHTRGHYVIHKSRTVWEKTGTSALWHIKSTKTSQDRIQKYILKTDIST